MSIQELEYIRLLLEIDPKATVREIAKVIRELRTDGKLKSSALAQ